MFRFLTLYLYRAKNALSGYSCHCVATVEQKSSLLEEDRKGPMYTLMKMVKELMVSLGC